MTESFTCPRCWRVSHHPEDVAAGYCGHCHDWTGPSGGAPVPSVTGSGSGDPPSPDPDVDEISPMCEIGYCTRCSGVGCAHSCHASEAEDQCVVGGCARPVAHPSYRLCHACYQRAWKRGELPPRAPRPIPRACPPDHPHGASLGCYNLHGCRCEACHQYRAAYDARSTRDRAYGRPPRMVDAEPVREHVIALSAAGIGRRTLAMLTGLDPSVIRSVVHGRRGKPVQQVRRQTAEKILAVSVGLGDMPDGAYVPAVAYVRRLQALVAAGWSQAQLAARLGMTRQNFRYLVIDDRLRARGHRTDQRMTAKRARAVVALYEELAMARPPKASAERARRYAAARGWPDPWDWAAYDDDFDRKVAPRRARAVADGLTVIRAGDRS